MTMTMMQLDPDVFVPPAEKASHYVWPHYETMKTRLSKVEGIGFDGGEGEDEGRKQKDYYS